MMTKIVVDPRLRALFHDLKQPLEFIDESGHTLGLFTPSVDPALLRPQIGDEEIQRLLRQGGGRPLVEILRDLEKQG